MNAERWVVRLSVASMLMMLAAVGATAWRRYGGVEERFYPATPPSASQMRSGRELLLVFVGSRGCAASTSPEVPPALEAIRAQASRFALEHGMRFVTIGVGIDAQANDALHFLKSVGEPFDEIIAGRNWLGQGATTYIFRDHRGEPAIPQVILIEREVTVAGSAGIEIGPDVLLARRNGVDQLQAWARGNAIASDLTERRAVEPH